MNRAGQHHLLSTFTSCQKVQILHLWQPGQLVTLIRSCRAPSVLCFITVTCHTYSEHFGHKLLHFNLIRFSLEGRLVRWCIFTLNVYIAIHATNINSTFYMKDFNTFHCCTVTEKLLLSVSLSLGEKGQFGPHESASGMWSGVSISRKTHPLGFDLMDLYIA